MCGFETRYAEAQRHRREKKEQSRKTGEVNEFALAGAELKKQVKERLRDGYKLEFEKEIAGRWRKPFTEPGLRSESSLVLKYFVTLVPKGGKARASNDKATLEVQSRSKLLTLDYPYVELNREFMAALRVDLDSIFVTPESLKFELTELVRDGRIPCMPHLVVGDSLADGRFARPHVIWLLPYGSAVWRKQDDRCRKGPIRLFDAVARGLAAALLEIGADPAAPTMTGRMKNPLSPIWHTMALNDSMWPTLADYADYVDTSANRAVLVRKAAALQSGLPHSPSNHVFDQLRSEGIRLLAEWHFAADARMQGSRAAVADHLQNALVRFAAEGVADTERVSYVTAKVADYLAFHFDSSKLDGKQKNRGKLLDIVCEMKTVRERQSAGGRYAGTAKGISTFEILLSTYKRLQGSGIKITQTLLAKESGITRRTVVTRWAEIVEAACIAERGCENRCIDKKAARSSVSVQSMTPLKTKPLDSVRPANDYDDTDPRPNNLPPKNCLLLMAVQWLGRQQNAMGSQRSTCDVIELIALDYPDQPNLDPTRVLAAANNDCDPDMATDAETFVDTILDLFGPADEAA